MASRPPARRPSNRTTKTIAVVACCAIGGTLIVVNFHAIMNFLVTLCVVSLIAAAYLNEPKLPTGWPRTHVPRLPNFQAMNWREFEYALADLCRRDGCSDVRVIGGPRDRGADVVAITPDGRKLVIQAKRNALTNKVGDRAVQVVNGTYRDTHRADLAAIVTTSTFTGPALEHAAERGIRTFDVDALARWASGTGPAPWELTA